MHLHKIGRNWLNASFANQITLFALSLTLGVSLLIGAGSYLALRTQIETAIQRDLAAEANLVESRLRQFITQASAELATLSRNSFIANGLVDSSGRDGYLRPFLRDFRLSIPGKEDTSLTLYDFSGKPLIQIRPDKATDTDTDTDTEVVGQAIATGKPQVRIITQGNQTYLKLVQPIHFPPTQSVEGALAVRIRLAPLLAGTDIALAEGQVLQLHAAGAVVAQIGASQGASRQDVLRVERALKLAAPFDTLGLRLTLDSSTRDAHGQLDRLTLIYVFGLLLLLPLVGWVTHRSSRRLVAPLAQLSATAGAIAISGVITVPLQIGGSSEVGRLADDFGRMLARLGATQVELNNQTAGLLASEARFANIVNLAADAIISVDEDQRILIFNDGAELIFGYTAAEMLGQPLDRLLPERYAEAHRGHIRQFGTEPENSRQMSKRPDIFGRRRDGSEFFAEANISHVMENGKLVFTVFLRDISARKQAEAERRSLEAQLRESQKIEAIGTLAGGIAHDFNNILGAIMGNVALARGDLPAGHAALKSLDQIGKGGARARSLVQQILTFSRRQPHELVNQPLRPLVEEALALLRSTLPARVSLEAVLSEAPLYLNADASQIQQVVMNLCTNAWHALQDSTGCITVGLEEVVLDAAAALAAGALSPGRYAHLWVRDTGTGIDAPTRARIFEPFFTTKPVGSGTGLGLSVVHGIVAAHQGAISVDSAVGMGSTFHLYFPAREHRAAGAAGAAAPVLSQPAALPGAGQHVLYVDDDEVMLLVVERLLQRAGYRVSCCQNASDALALVGAAPDAVDVVVTDYNMPTRSGLELAEALAQVRADLPVVISSGYISEELRSGAERLGVRHLLQKQDMSEELAGLLRRVLSR